MILPFQKYLNIDAFYFTFYLHFFIFLLTNTEKYATIKLSQMRHSEVNMTLLEAYPSIIENPLFKNVAKVQNKV